MNKLCIVFCTFAFANVAQACNFSEDFHQSNLRRLKDEQIAAAVQFNCFIRSVPPKIQLMPCQQRAPQEIVEKASTTTQLTTKFSARHAQWLQKNPISIDSTICGISGEESPVQKSTGLTVD